MSEETQVMENPQSEPAQEVQNPTLSVVLKAGEWGAVCQLLSLGVRQADDSVLEVGGRLLREIKAQLAPDQSNGSS